MFKQRNVKYAMKAGIAIALLASPAFFDATRPFFVEYQGDWALVSVRVAFIWRALKTRLMCAPDLCGDLAYNRCYEYVEFPASAWDIVSLSCILYPVQY